MEKPFDKLVQELDEEGLASLRQAVMSELKERRQQGGVRLEDIHPAMSDADRERVRRQIAWVLRGEE